MPRVTELFAFVGEDSPGEEGLIAYLTAHGWMPMVGADTARVEVFKEKAQELATATGRPIQILRFSVRETIEVIQP